MADFTTHYYDYAAELEEELRERLRERLSQACVEYKEKLSELWGGTSLGEPDAGLASALTDIAEQAVAEEDWLDYIATILSVTAEEARAKPDGFVYVLKAGQYYKIGKTKRLNQRIKTLEIQLPFPVEVFNVFPCEDYSQAERELHKFFGRDRVNGEWFKPPDAALEWLGQVTHITKPRGEYSGLGEQFSHHYEVPSALCENWLPALAKAEGFRERA